MIICRGADKLLRSFFLFFFSHTLMYSLSLRGSKVVWDCSYHDHLQCSEWPKTDKGVYTSPLLPTHTRTTHKHAP